MRTMSKRCPQPREKIQKSQTGLSKTWPPNTGKRKVSQQFLRQVGDDEFDTVLVQNKPPHPPKRLDLDCGDSTRFVFQPMSTSTPKRNGGRKDECSVPSVIFQESELGKHFSTPSIAFQKSKLPSAGRNTLGQHLTTHSIVFHEAEFGQRLTTPSVVFQESELLSAERNKLGQHLSTPSIAFREAGLGQHLLTPSIVFHEAELPSAERNMLGQPSIAFHESELTSNRDMLGQRLTMSQFIGTLPKESDEQKENMKRNVPGIEEISVNISNFLNEDSKDFKVITVDDFAEDDTQMSEVDLNKTQNLFSFINAECSSGSVEDRDAQLSINDSTRFIFNEIFQDDCGRRRSMKAPGLRGALLTDFSLNNFKLPATLNQRDDHERRGIMKAPGLLVGSSQEDQVRRFSDFLFKESTAPPAQNQRDDYKGRGTMKAPRLCGASSQEDQMRRFSDFLSMESTPPPAQNQRDDHERRGSMKAPRPHVGSSQEDQMRWLPLRDPKPPPPLNHVLVWKGVQFEIGELRELYEVLKTLFGDSDFFAFAGATNLQPLTFQMVPKCHSPASERRK